jgi:hypothetical protein
LKLKDVIAERARKHQSIVGGDRKSLSQEVVKAVTEPIHTDKELGKIAGVSHETHSGKIRCEISLKLGGSPQD